MKPTDSEWEILDTPVAELLRRWPTISRSLIACRLACIGCGFSRFATLNQALEAHQISPERFLRQLQKTTRAQDR